jgi:tetratricopeptide (TPR) repeat protein
MIGDALRWIAAADGRVGNLAAARAGYAESLEVCRALESEAGAARVMYFLAESEFAAGDAEAAARHATEALGIWRARDNAQMVAGIVANLAAYEVALGRYDLARLHAREALTLARSLRVEQLGMRAILNLAAAAACEPVTADDGMDQRRARAARLLGFFDAHGADWQSEAAESVVYGRLVEALARAFPPDELRALRDAGAALSEDAAVALALDDA